MLVVASAVAAWLWPAPAKVSETSEPDLQPAPVSAPAPAVASAPTPTPVPASAPVPASVPAPAPSAPAEELPHLATKQIDLADRFTVGGSGTEMDPFRIPWSLLKSADENMDLNGPRATPPDRLQLFHDAWIQISGYLAPPLWGEETSELLVMFNRWDGCCIGLPPTPFDCIEAQLAQPIKLGAQHSIRYGTIQGKLVVQPFKAGSFLIGLYRLESARTDEMQTR